MVATSEEISGITESLYRNLNEKYYPEIRDLIACGKIYEKALAGVSQSAKNYAEALMRLGDLASQSKGSHQLGSVLHQIADTHKRIETDREQNILIFRREILLPLETKTEQDSKETSIKQKAYLQGNKVKTESLVKAKDKLQKQANKAQKSKKNYKYDDKLQQSNIEVKEKQEDLQKHRNLGLKEVLLDERTHYCYVIDRECKMLKNYQVYHSKAHHLIESQLEGWQEASRKPGQLPDECVALLIGKENVRSSGGSVNSSSSGRQSRYSGHYDKALLPPNDRHRSTSQPPPAPPTQQQQKAQTVPAAELIGNYEGAPPLPPDGSGVAQTLPRNYQAQMKARSDANFSPKSVSGSAQRTVLYAVYNHTATSPNQMSFSQGDIISVVGEKRNGWQYGRNTRTEKNGWFPISFTRDPQTTARLSDPQPISVLTKTKSNSAGNLLADDSEIPSTDYPEKSSFPDPDSTDSGGLLMVAANSQTLPAQRHQADRPHYENTDFRRQWKQSQPLPSPPQPATPTNGASNSHSLRQGTRHGAAQLDSFPPPPPPLPQDSHDENPKSSMFANVSLRPTVTNDRSAPLF